MTGQYHLEIIISKEEVEIIKEQFQDFIEDAGGFCVYIHAENEATEPSEELENAIRKIFFNILMTINHGKFEGVQ